jgi:hypothetical protein
VTSTGAGCFFLSSALIIATPFWQSDLLSANAPVPPLSWPPLRLTGLNAACVAVQDVLVAR